MKKRIVFASAVVLILTLPVVVCFHASKPTVAAVTVKLISSGPAPESHNIQIGIKSATGMVWTTLWTASVWITNTTAKRVAMQISTLQSRSGNQWTSSGETNIVVLIETLPSHRTATNQLDFLRNPLLGNRRFRVSVAEELTGIEKVMQGTRMFVKNLSDKVRGRATTPLMNSFSSRTIYYGHNQEVFTDEFE